MTSPSAHACRPAHSCSVLAPAPAGEGAARTPVVGLAARGSRRQSGGPRRPACAQPDGSAARNRVFWISCRSTREPPPPGDQMTITTTPRTTTRTTPGTGRHRGPDRGSQQVLRHRRRGRHRARQRDRRPPRGPVHRDHGPLGLRQVDAAAHARRPRPAHVGPGVPRGHRDHLAQGQGAHPAASRPDRLHLPVVQPAPDHDRGREHRAADADRGTETGPALGGLDRRDRRAHRPPRPPALGALRWPAAARRRGPGAGVPAGHRLRGRADRRPGLAVRHRAAPRSSARRSPSSARPSSW